MQCDAAMDQVRRALESTGYPMDRVHLVQGRVEDSLPGQAPEQLALLRLDTDFYISTSHELVHLYPRLAAGGVLIIDDYGAWQGARQAVDEYFDGRPVLLHRLDWTGRLVMKP
jgi:O-methyltransferase